MNIQVSEDSDIERSTASIQWVPGLFKCDFPALPATVYYDNNRQI